MSEQSNAKPCCARVIDLATQTYGFCGLVDGHGGDHVPVKMSRTPTPSDFGPKRPKVK